MTDIDRADMVYPVACRFCHHVHDQMRQPMEGRYLDCSTWRCPGCQVLIDDRPEFWGGSAIRQPGHPNYQGAEPAPKRKKPARTVVVADDPTPYQGSTAPANGRLDLHEVVYQLTEWHTHREPYEYDAVHASGSTTHYHSHHATHQPSLLEQVWGTAGSRGQGGEVGSMTPGSKPAANIDALDCASRIDQGAARRLVQLGVERPPRDSMVAIRLLHQMSFDVERCTNFGGRRATCCPFHAIESDLRGWWASARVLTGWDTSALRLNGTCPLCGVLGSVRVRFSASIATCTECYETWDHESIGLLADHMRMEGEAERFARETGPEPCSPVADDDEVARIMLCPDCGSRRCAKAQEQVVKRLVERSPSARRRPA